MAESGLDVCDVFCYNEEKVRRLRRKIQEVEGLAPLFKALGDETRLKIIYALTCEELCVCDVASISGTTVATASHHLRYLKNAGLARYRRQGKMIFYSLDNHCVSLLLETALTHRDLKL
ncbi:MAG: Cadmium resistance transcriptional regulatory protein CadC [Firmicutes bacterium ADurb.Bin456]|nr:MAG: Cadmium resistance transcriptional regulatory protein CadC [Firmicutes bacterium ADurb.Bin456]